MGLTITELVVGISTGCVGSTIGTVVGEVGTSTGPVGSGKPPQVGAIRVGIQSKLG
jgi:hypothetical protein